MCENSENPLFHQVFFLFFLNLIFLNKDKKKHGRSKARREGRRAADSQFKLLMNAGGSEASSLCLTFSSRNDGIDSLGAGLCRIGTTKGFLRSGKRTVGLGGKSPAFQH